MSTPFTFSHRQRLEIVKELGGERGVVSLEGLVQRYREQCAARVPPATIRDQLKETHAHARRLQRTVRRLARLTQGQAEWLLEPLEAYESYAAALLKYRFPRRLRPGRQPHIAEIQLVQAAASLWETVRGRAPGRGRGPFSRLVGKLLRYSEVPGARTSYPEELVAEALPARLSIGMRGPGCPFRPLGEEEGLSAAQRAAERFFQRVDFVVRGKPTLTVFPSGKGGKIGKKI